MVLTKIPRLKIAERFKKLEYYQKETLDETLSELSRSGKVMMVRPTGFGKTKLLIDIAKLYVTKFKRKIMYVYPINIIKTEIHSNKEYMADGLIDKHVEFVSYWELANEMNTKGAQQLKETLQKKFKLIILDEVHRAGSIGIGALMEELKMLISAEQLHVVGATATPNRMYDTEDTNVLNDIFDGNTISEFTLADAILNGIMIEPRYGICRYDIKDTVERFKEAQKKVYEQQGKVFNEKHFNAELVKEMRNIRNAPDFIHHYLKEAGYNLDKRENQGFKFIAFFNNVADMAERGPTVVEWFKTAFNVEAKKYIHPNDQENYKIKTYYVAYSDKKLNDIVGRAPNENKFIRDADRIGDIYNEPGVVNLIFNVNMISMGYHAKDITGIAMLRSTESEIVYFQQLGRSLSVRAEKNPIVYDFVNNKDVDFDGIKDKNNSLDNLTNIMTGVREKSERSKRFKDLDSMDLIITDHEDGLSELLNRWANPDYSLYSEIKWLYEERHAPICVIASDTKKSCKEIIQILRKTKTKLHHEDSMHDYCTDKNRLRLKILPFIVSKKSFNYLRKLGIKSKHIIEIFAGAGRIVK